MAPTAAEIAANGRALARTQARAGEAIPLTVKFKRNIPFAGAVEFFMPDQAYQLVGWDMSAVATASPVSDLVIGISYDPLFNVLANGVTFRNLIVGAYGTGGFTGVRSLMPIGKGGVALRRNEPIHFLLGINGGPLVNGCRGIFNLYLMPMESAG
jgi:hypothetical protein